MVQGRKEERPTVVEDVEGVLGEGVEVEVHVDEGGVHKLLVDVEFGVDSYAANQLFELTSGYF